MKRFITLSMDAKLETYDYENPKEKVGPYIIDDSNFVPISEAIKQLNKVAPVSDEEIAAAYDFVDGKDNGMTIPITRRNNIAMDVVEVSTEIMKQTEVLSEKITNEKLKAERKAKFEADLHAISNNKTESPNPSAK